MEDKVAAVYVEGLTRRYGSTVAVDNLSFIVKEGSVVGFLGWNDAGKTTTLRFFGWANDTDAWASAHTGASTRRMN